MSSTEISFGLFSSALLLSVTLSSITASSLSIRSSLLKSLISVFLSLLSVLISPAAILFSKSLPSKIESPIGAVDVLVPISVKTLLKLIERYIAPDTLEQVDH